MAGKIITQGMWVRCPNSESWVLLGPKLWVCFADWGLKGKRMGEENKGRQGGEAVHCPLYHLTLSSLLFRFVLPYQQGFGSIEM